MDKDDKASRYETSDDGYPIEIYTGARIREFLSDDKLTPELKKRIEEKLKESKTPKSPPQNGPS